MQGAISVAPFVLKIMRHVLFKVKKDKEDSWRKWCVYLVNNKKEVIETLKEENAVYERCLMYEREGEYYVVGSSAFNGEPKKANLEVEINKLHVKAKKDFLGSALAVFEGEFKMPPKFEMLYEFDLR